MLYVRGDANIRGIEGATRVAGRAIRVGTGIDVCYPKENRKLYPEGAGAGSHPKRVPTWSHPARENFPAD